MPTNSSGDGLRLALVAHDAKKDQLIEWAAGTRKHPVNGDIICHRYHRWQDNGRTTSVECDLSQERATWWRSTIGIDNLRGRFGRTYLLHRPSFPHAT